MKQEISSRRRFDAVDQLEESAKRERDSLLVLYQLLRRSTGVKQKERLFAILADLVLEFFEPATHVTIYIRDEKSRYRAALHEVRSEGPPETPPPLSRTLLKHVTEKREAIIFADPLETLADARSLRQQRIQSGICVPLWDQQEIRGILQVDRRGFTGAFEDRHLDLLTLIGNHAAVILSNLEMVVAVRQLNERLVETLQRVELLDRAKAHLAKYVPRAVRTRVEERPDDLELATESTDATVLFLDIGGYTKLTESLSQERVNWLVETYFSSFIDSIQKQGGDINETAGDGLMVIFRGARPEENARHAVRATLDIREQTRRINAKMEGVEPIDVNMGVESGPVTVGSRRIQGLVEERWTYTATGMVTNLSARVAQHARGGQILIGSGTAALVGREFALNDLGEVAFRNVAEKQRVYEVLGRAGVE